MLLDCIFVACRTAVSSELSWHSATVSTMAASHSGGFSSVSQHGIALPPVRLTAEALAQLQVALAPPPPPPVPPRLCANPPCEKRRNLSQCGGCRRPNIVYYCSLNCDRDGLKHVISSFFVCYVWLVLFFCSSCNICGLTPTSEATGRNCVKLAISLSFYSGLPC